MQKELNLYIDESPADLHQKKIFCMAVVDAPDSLGFIGALLMRICPFWALRYLKPRIYVGHIDAQKKPEILSYLENGKFFSQAKITGVNMLWSTVLIYSFFGFIRCFYNYNQPPPINIFHDPKSMRKDHRENTYNFLKVEIPKWFEKFTDEKVKPVLLKIEEGKKKSVGIKMADFVAREFIKSGESKLKKVSSITIQDLSGYVAQNPTELSF